MFPASARFPIPQLPIDPLSRQGDIKAPPCTCFRCSQQFLSLDDQQAGLVYRSSVSEEDGKLFAAKVVETLNSCRAYLLYNCAIYGGTIYSRWKKRSREKRALLLKETDPSMYEHQWYETRIDDEDFVIDDELKARRMFLLPYVNVEALKEDPTRLMGLLMGRIRYKPEEWAFYDNSFVHLPWRLGALDLAFNKNCVVMHGQKYGELVPWEATSVHRGDTIGFPRAMLVFQAQYELMRILSSLVEKLVEGLSNQPNPADFEMVDIMTAKKAKALEFATAYLGHPYTASPVFDMEKLVSIAQTRHDLNQDHLYELQTNPDYLRREVSLIDEGEYKNIIGLGEYSFAAIDLEQDIWIARFWEWTLEEVKSLQACQAKCAGDITPGSPLPDEFDKKLGLVELLLTQTMEGQAKMLEKVIAQRPGFRHLWNFDHRGPGETILTRKTKGTGSRLDSGQFVRDPIEWVLSQVTEGFDATRPANHSRMFEMLDQVLASSSAEERGRIDEILYKKLSNLAAIYEMLAMVRLQHPQATKLELSDAQSEDGNIWKYFRAKDGLESYFPPSIYKPLGRNLGTFVGYPAPCGKRDQAWLDRAELSRKAQSTFWEHLRRWEARLLKSIKLSEEDIEKDSLWLSADRHPDYLNALQLEKEQVKASIAADLALRESQAEKAAKELLDARPSSTRKKRAKKQAGGKDALSSTNEESVESEALPEVQGKSTVSSRAQAEVSLKETAKADSSESPQLEHRATSSLDDHTSRLKVLDLCDVIKVEKKPVDPKSADQKLEESSKSGGHSSSHTSISENTTRQIHPPFFKKS